MTLCDGVGPDQGARRVSFPPPRCLVTEHDEVAVGLPASLRLELRRRRGGGGGNTRHRRHPRRPRRRRCSTGQRRAREAASDKPPPQQEQAPAAVAAPPPTRPVTRRGRPRKPRTRSGASEDALFRQWVLERQRLQHPQQPPPQKQRNKPVRSRRHSRTAQQQQQRTAGGDIEQVQRRLRTQRCLRELQDQRTTQLRAWQEQQRRIQNKLRKALSLETTTTEPNERSGQSVKEKSPPTAPTGPGPPKAPPPKTPPPARRTPSRRSLPRSVDLGGGDVKSTGAGRPPRPSSSKPSATSIRAAARDPPSTCLVYRSLIDEKSPSETITLNPMDSPCLSSTWSALGVKQGVQQTAPVLRRSLGGPASLPRVPGSKGSTGATGAQGTPLSARGSRSTGQADPPGVLPPVKAAASSSVPAPSDRAHVAKRAKSADGGLQGARDGGGGRGPQRKAAVSSRPSSRSRSAKSPAPPSRPTSSRSRASAVGNVAAPPGTSPSVTLSSRPSPSTSCSAPRRRPLTARSPITSSSALPSTSPRPPVPGVRDRPRSKSGSFRPASGKIKVSVAEASAAAAIRGREGKRSRPNPPRPAGAGAAVSATHKSDGNMTPRERSRTRSGSRGHAADRAVCGGGLGSASRGAAVTSAALRGVRDGDGGREARPTATRRTRKRSRSKSGGATTQPRGPHVAEVPAVAVRPVPTPRRIRRQPPAGPTPPAPPTPGIIPLVAPDEALPASPRPGAHSPGAPRVAVRASGESPRSRGQQCRPLPPPPPPGPGSGSGSGHPLGDGWGVARFRAPRPAPPPRQSSLHAVHRAVSRLETIEDEPECTPRQQPGGAAPALPV